MTHLTLEARTMYIGRAHRPRWWKSLTAQAGQVLALLACYPPYTLDYEPPAYSEWNRYEPASDWLKEHPQADAIGSPA